MIACGHSEADTGLQGVANCFCEVSYTNGALKCGEGEVIYRNSYINISFSSLFVRLVIKI